MLYFFIFKNKYDFLFLNIIAVIRVSLMLPQLWYEKHFKSKYSRICRESRITVKMKVLAIFVALFVLGCHSKSSLKFNTVKCGVSLKSAVEPYCYIKAYARRYPMLNLGFKLLRKVPDGLVWKFLAFFMGPS